MLPSVPSSKEEYPYIIPNEGGAEATRLTLQDKLLTQAMGGLFPEHVDLPTLERVLDIACGHGGWAAEVAFAYPESEVIGIDINRSIVSYAQAMARAQGLTNVMFGVMDAREPLDFDENCFDLVNARLLSGFMDTQSWPKLLQECKRILKAGGILRLTEIESSFTNSLATQCLNKYLYRVLSNDGRTFSPDGGSLGIAPMLEKLLQDAGFENIEKRAFFVDTSSGTELHASGCKEAKMVFTLLKPYLLSSGTVGEAEFEELYQAMVRDMARDDFRRIALGITSWGKKPCQS